MDLKLLVNMRSILDGATELMGVLGVLLVVLICVHYYVCPVRRVTTLLAAGLAYVMIVLGSAYVVFFGLGFPLMYVIERMDTPHRELLAVSLVFLLILFSFVGGVVCALGIVKENG